LIRRDLLIRLACLSSALILPRAAARAQASSIALGEPEPFDATMLRDQARALAQAPYQPPDGSIPDALANLSYDQLRDIRFRPEMSLWRGQGLDVEAQFFHLGNGYRNPVHIFEVANGQAREILYAPELFDFGANAFEERFSEHLGFAGLRVHVPLNRPDYLDELVAFLGASYFRAVSRGQRYGISARGIAVNTGLPGAKEEFPAFRAFWLERPPPGAERLVVHALLDGPSIVGAYTLAIRPGETTTMTINAALFPRQPIELLGLAPLTSMYLFGANDRMGVDDFRPNVHDSEGLEIWSGRGEWIWRPLANPSALRLSVFGDDNPKGFGLIQRNRAFDFYQDLEARYELRPSLWVEPLGQWGRGQLRLVELPTRAEVHDNIAAFWVPEQRAEPGIEWQIAYRLHWCKQPPVRPDVAEVVDTRVGGGGVAGPVDGLDPRRKFVIDFAGGQLSGLPEDAGVEPAFSVSQGQITTPVVHKNPVTGGWRVFFDFTPAGPGPAEFRGLLRLGDNILTQTWTYQWTG
jgi:periplasmic glucans biosynthesis protein